MLSEPSLLFVMFGAAVAALFLKERARDADLAATDAKVRYAGTKRFRGC